MRDLIFVSDRHRDFFEQNMAYVRNDSYHKALFYLLGVSEETRRHFESLFDYNEDTIRPEGLAAGWQTSGTGCLCRLAFNLWNGYTEPDQEQNYKPYDLLPVSLHPTWRRGSGCTIRNISARIRKRFYIAQ